MRDRFVLAALAALVLAVGSGALLLGTARRGAFAEPLSTYRAAPDGARALFLLAAQAGLRVSRRHLDFADLPTSEDRPGLLILLGIDSVREADVEKLQRFVSEGGALLLVAGAPADGKEKGAGAKGKGLLESLAALGKRSVFEAFSVKLEPPVDASPARELEVGIPSPLVAGVEQVQARVTSHLARQDNDRELPLLVDPRGGGGRVAIAFAHGAGRVVAISSADLASNRALGLADNARFWLSALQALSGGKPIEFDENHHGFTGERSISGYAARHGLHWGALQLVVALFVWVAALQRFGAQRQVAADERSAGADYLLAMARIYRLGQHRAHAAHLLLSGLARSLGRYASAPMGASRAKIAAALERRGRADLARSLRSLEGREEAASHGDRALLSLARACAGARDLAGAHAAPGAAPGGLRGLSRRRFVRRGSREGPSEGGIR